jgi:hypothetical protein
MGAKHLAGGTNNGHQSARASFGRNCQHLGCMGAGVMGLQHMAFKRPVWPLDDRHDQAQECIVMRSYAPVQSAQPGRRALMLVYLACVAVPFAVAAMAYMLRATLAEPTSPNASAKLTIVNTLADGAPSAHQRPHQAAAHSSMSLLPSATAAELLNPHNTPPPTK